MILATSFAFDSEWDSSNKSEYYEKNLSGDLYGFSLYPVKDYKNDTIFYIGLGNSRFKSEKKKIRDQISLQNDSPGDCACQF